MIPAPDARGRKAAGNLICPRVEFSVRDARIAAHERFGVRPAPYVLFDDGREIQHTASSIARSIVAISSSGVNGTSSSRSRLSLM